MSGTAGAAASRSGIQAGRDGFRQLLHAEWTKLRTVPGWLTGMAAAALVIAGLGVLAASGSVCSGGPSPGHPNGAACTAVLGPGGEVVTDRFYFVHQPLTGRASITARVTSLTGRVFSHQGSEPGLAPWAKGGIMFKASTRPGSAYVALLVTGGHGVRMQWDFTRDRAGLPGQVTPATARWLRLTRSGATFTGYDSADGRHWARVAVAHLAGLPATLQAGLLATAPDAVHRSSSPGGAAGLASPGQATAVLSRIHLTGTGAGSGWSGTAVSGPGGPLTAGLGGYRQARGTFTVSGSGDIAPAVAPGGGGTPIGQTLIGVFGGLIAVAVVAAGFIGAEYRSGMILSTLAANPRRGRVLAAKAVVIGAVTFAAGLAGAAAAMPLAEHVLRGNGNFMAPASLLVQVRVIAGTAALLAVTAILALALAAVLRSASSAVLVVVVTLVLPYLAGAATPVLPAAAADWLLRVTPAAAFAVQATGVRYPQVAGTYLPFFGYYPLPPWAGFAVLCGYTALALAAAVILLRRRDA